MYRDLGNQGATNAGQMIHIATIIPLTWAIVMTNVVLAQAHPNYVMLNLLLHVNVNYG